MKKIITLLFILISGSAFSQSIYVLSDSAYASRKTTSATFYPIINVYNSTSSDILVNWVRHDVNVPANWKTSVCDSLICHPDTVNSGSFIIPANGRNNVYFHFYPNGTGLGSGIVTVSVDGNPSEFVDLKFYGLAWMTGIEEINSGSFSLYPNPVKNSLFINPSSQKSFYNIEISDMKGAVLLFSVYNKEVDVSFLPAGNYVCKLVGANGASLVKKFLKQ